jgi:hypothetical protein
MYCISSLGQPTWGDPTNQALGLINYRCRMPAFYEMLLKTTV